MTGVQTCALPICGGNGGGFSYTRQVIPQSCGIKFADGSVLNTGNISSTSAVELYANEIYVDPVYGNDSTGLKYRIDKPFQTLIAAKNAAVSGDTIIGLSGTHYVDRSLFKPNIKYHFYTGAIIIASIYPSFLVPDTGLFSDEFSGSYKANFDVTGNANIFLYSTYGCGLVKAVQNQTTMNIEFNNADCYTGATFWSAGTKARVFVKFNQVIENLAYGSIVGLSTDGYLNLKGRNFVVVPSTSSSLQVMDHRGGPAIDAEIDLIESYSESSWTTIVLRSGSPAYVPIVNFKGKIQHQAPNDDFMRGVLGFMDSPGVINFEGEIVTNAYAVSIYAGAGPYSNKRRINIKNSVIKQENLLDANTDTPLINANNSDKIGRAHV